MTENNFDLPDEKMLSFVRQYKDREDVLHKEITEGTIPLDTMAYCCDTKVQLGVYKCFKTAVKLKDTNVLRAQTVDGKAITLTLSVVTANKNQFSAFDPTKKDDQLAYFDFKTSDKPLIKEKDASKYVNMGVAAEFIYDDKPDMVVSLKYWFYGTGKISVILGLRHESSGDNKIIDSLSKVLTDTSRFLKMVIDGTGVIWTYIIKKHLESPREPPSKQEWKIKNISSMSRLSRSWGIEWPSIQDFKVNTRLLLEYRIMEMGYEGGFLSTVGEDRMSTKDSYFSIKIRYCPFHMLFEKGKPKYRENGTIVMYDCVLNNRYWKQGKRGRRGKDISGKRFFDSIILNTKTHEIVVTGEKNDQEDVYSLDLDAMPQASVKIYMTGKIQISGISKKSPYPWYTFWRSMVYIIEALNATGIPKKLTAIRAKKPAGFEWLDHIPTDQSILDMSESKKLSDDRGLKSEKFRKGRKEGTTCKPANRIPQPQSEGFEGSCEDGFVVYPNKYGDACCFKITDKIKNNPAYLLELYKEHAIPVPAHILSSFGLSSRNANARHQHKNADNVAVPLNDHANRNANAARKEYIIKFDDAGNMIINKLKNFRVPFLLKVADHFGISDKVVHYQEIRPKTGKQLSQDIARHALMHNGIPKFKGDGEPGTREERKIASILQVKKLVGAPESKADKSYKDHRQSLKEFIKSLQHDKTDSENHDDNKPFFIKSPAYPSKYSPYASQSSNLLSITPVSKPSNSKTNNGNQNIGGPVRHGASSTVRFDDHQEEPKRKFVLTETAKLTLVLDQLFNFTSEDIRRIKKI